MTDQEPQPAANERVVTPMRDAEELQYEAGLRPRTLADYVGQERVRENLAVSIEATRQRREALDHVLLYGPPGLGKTTLAYIVAQELDVQIRTTSGPVLERPGDLAALLTNLKAHEVLFIDEIHRMSPGHRGDPLSGPGGLRARHRHRAGSQRAVGQGAAPAVHADRRHDARGPAHRAPPYAVRDRASPRLLHGERPARDRYALGPHPERADRRRRGRGAGPARQGHAAGREPPPAPGTRLCGGPRGRRGRHRGGEAGAGAAGGGRQRLRRGGPAAAAGCHRQVRRRAGRFSTALRRRSARKRKRSKISTSRSSSRPGSSTARRAAGLRPSARTAISACRGPTAAPGSGSSPW